jgi:hypothetical protein
MSLEYKEHNSSQWITAHPLTVDRRDTVINDGSSISNPYNNQYRGSIFSLEPDTEYHVKVTYTDIDGVSNSPETATVKTRQEYISLGSGVTYYVATNGNDTNAGTEETPFATIQHAASADDATETARERPDDKHRTQDTLLLRYYSLAANIDGTEIPGRRYPPGSHYCSVLYLRLSLHYGRQ